MVDKARAAPAAYQTALRQEQALEAELESSNREALDQNSASAEYPNLKLEVETRRDLLDELLKRQSETEVAAGSRAPGSPTSASSTARWSRAGPSGRRCARTSPTACWWGCCRPRLRCAVEFLDRTVKTPEEVERRLGLPTLAVIPDITDGPAYGGYGYGTAATRPAAGAAAAGKAAGVGWRRRAHAPSPIELVPHERPRMPISEAYRSLRTALLLSTAGELKVVAVTSAVAGEGKTATATNLAVVMAQLGRQVLLVDADLRKPRLHQVFQVSNRRAGQLSDRQRRARRVFLPTAVPKLCVIPAGPIPPNPSELLASDRMREWLAPCARASTSWSSTRRRSCRSPTPPSSARWWTAWCSPCAPAR